MKFNITGSIFLLTTLISLFLLWLRVRPSPSLPHFLFPNLADFPDTSSKRSRWLPRLLFLHGAALLFFLLALTDPHLTSEKPASSSPGEPREGLAIYLILDQSGSMREGQKLQMLKQVTKTFIEERSSDLMGLVAFARVPQILVPLTLDKAVLVEALEKIKPVELPQEDGTAMGYAIYKTASLLAATKEMADTEKDPTYTIKSGVLLVVTDGFQDPSALDKGNALRTMELDEAASHAKKEGLHLYIVSIDPLISQGEYLPQRKQLQEVTGKTGGDFFLVDNAHGLKEIYQEINRLEKGKVEALSPSSSRLERSFSLYPYLLVCGLALLFTAIFLNHTWLRTVP